MCINGIDNSQGSSIIFRKKNFNFIGGNKRRLSLAVALLTLPDVLLLDEPTTGVDPKASRVIWNILSKIRESGTALVLTSHSMEECDALCTQIAIMISGGFKCLGSTQHIKSKYGNGYSLAIRLRATGQIGPAKEMMKRIFPNSRLMSEHILHLNYELAVREKETWSVLFEKVEKLVEAVDASDYSISQTTLDQVIERILDFQIK
uniref:ATPase AAA-type core domain-containing protein n=1 Tax=Setaria digitata TaxID=48799 RepID=A0A915PWE3_9BILA